MLKFTMKVLMVVFGLVAISLSLPGPHRPNVTCAKSQQIFSSQNFTFDKDYRNHLDYAVSSINYCEFNGNFVFYSEKNFEGDVKYGYHKKHSYLKELDPVESKLTAVKSVRLIGDENTWDANTLTFFEFENFKGRKEVFDDSKTMAEEGDLLWTPESAVVTGKLKWNVYTDQGEWEILQPFNHITASPWFYESLQYNILKVRQEPEDK